MLRSSLLIHYSAVVRLSALLFLSIEVAFEGLLCLSMALNAMQGAQEQVVRGARAARVRVPAIIFRFSFHRDPDRSHQRY